jgi:hypothetical protein
VTFRTKLCMVNKITHFSDIAMEISENPYAQTLLMSQLRSNSLVDSMLLCLQIDQKTNEIFVRISALASKKRSNQKSSSPINGIKSAYFFDLTSF